MPLYEYHCQDCHAEFEALTSFANADNVACEKCGSQHVERVASAFACSMQGAGGTSAPLPACGGGG